MRLETSTYDQGNRSPSDIKSTDTLIGLPASTTIRNKFLFKDDLVIGILLKQHKELIHTYMK
jgi:hypothetical protein